MRPNPTPQRDTILFVDDEELLGTLVKMTLENIGLRVVVATNISDAQKALIFEPIKVMLTDIRLNGESGWDLIRSVTPGTIPIVAFSADEANGPIGAKMIDAQVIDSYIDKGSANHEVIIKACLAALNSHSCPS